MERFKHISSIDRNFSNRTFIGSTYLVENLLLVIGLYSCCRIAFYIFNTSFFPEMDIGRFSLIMLSGILFDLIAVLLSNSIFILMVIVPFHFRLKGTYQSALKFFFLIINSIALAVNIADIIYYRFTLQRTTPNVFDQFKNERNLWELIAIFLLDYWYIGLVFTCLILLLVAFNKKIKYREQYVKCTSFFYGSGITVIILFIIFFVGVLIGKIDSPIKISFVASMAKKPSDINLILNTPLLLMRGVKLNHKKMKYFSSLDELNKVYNPYKIPANSLSFKNKNVVILILESFSMEFIGAYNKELSEGKYLGYTPFLDSLISVSQSSRYSVANGRKSIDAMPSVICSIPSIESPYLLSNFSRNKINSLASLLHNKGYYSAFFHGAPNGSMGFDDLPTSVVLMNT